MKNVLLKVLSTLGIIAIIALFVGCIALGIMKDGAILNSDLPWWVKLLWLGKAHKTPGEFPGRFSLSIQFSMPALISFSRLAMPSFHFLRNVLALAARMTIWLG